MRLFITVVLFFTFISCSTHKGVVNELPLNAIKTGMKLDGGNIEFLGYYTDPIKPRHGEGFKLVTFWKFKEQLKEDWKLFYHFESESGEEHFKYDHQFLDGKVQKLALGKIIKNEAVIKSLPIHFDTDTMFIRGGFFKGNERTKPEREHDDGKSRLNMATIKITKPNILRKKMEVFAIAGKSRNQTKIDGEFKESYWSNASKDDKFWRSDGKGLSKTKTSVMAVMDNEYLHIGFDVADSDIYAEQTNNDTPIYETDDVVEIFIDPRGEGKIYYEIQVSAAGVKFDTKFNGRRKNRDDKWDSKIKYAVKVDGKLNDNEEKDKGWRAEIAIPWSSIEDAPSLPPKDGESWKVFFYRINRHTNKKSKADDFTAWTPPYSNDFHNIKFMGELLFVYEEIL
ncbi:MAG: carbohydrate-binding family 9-like protein [bacterium]